MFEDWLDNDVYADSLRRVDPPIPVTVDLSRWVINVPADQLAGKVALATRNRGFDLRNPNTPGLLHGWLKSSLGSWVGVVELELWTGDGQRSMLVQHLVAEQWITPHAH